MDADIITISDRPAGLLGSVLRGLAAMSVAAAFLAGIIFATWVSGESEVSKPRVSPAARAAVSAVRSRPALPQAFAIYVVSSSDQKSAVEAAFEKLRQEPGLSGFDAAALYIAEDAGGQVALDILLTDMNSIRIEAGLPASVVVDLRPPASR